MAHRSKLVGARPAHLPLRAQEANWNDVAQEKVEGPYLHRLYHGTYMECVRSIGEDKRLRGFGDMDGGAALNMIYFHGYSGVFRSGRAAAVIRRVAGSSKAPEGVILECKAWTRFIAVHSGGHAAEHRLCRGGLSTHNTRSKAWVVHEDDAELVALILVI